MSSSMNPRSIQRPSRWRRAVALSVVLGLCRLCVDHSTMAQAPQELTEAALATSLYTVRASFYRKHVPPPAVEGGGIVPFGDQFLLVTGDGNLYVLDRRDGMLRVMAARGRVPINSDAFRASAGNQKVQAAWFRVAGVAVQEVGETTLRIFVSYHFWKDNERCFVLRVSMVEGTPAVLWQAERLNWQTLFETVPCLPIKPRGHPFAGHQSGGRMVLLDDRTLLLTVGDHEYDGVASPQDYPQDASASYGKTIAVNLERKSARIFTSGHRNPQGLVVRSDGTIWSTEQGPQGGDELNHLLAGQNYGWPLVTFGTNYGSRTWPRNDAQGRHDRFSPPVFAWVPSVGISNLIELHGPQFQKWDGDLLIASLSAGTLFRVRTSGDRALFVEPIKLGERIRDLAVGRDGSIVLWLDWAGIAVLDTVQEASVGGEALFSATCGGCHLVGDGSAHRIGPDLRAFAARDVGSARGYTYSAALARVGGRWTAARLDSFLLDPETAAPGTTMRGVTVKDPTARAALVAYLSTLTQ